jgi:hypothetical protein
VNEFFARYVFFACKNNISYSFNALRTDDISVIPRRADTDVDQFDRETHDVQARCDVIHNELRRTCDLNAPTRRHTRVDAPQQKAKSASSRRR